MKKLVDPRRTFMLPNAVGVAIMSQRAELIHLAIRQVESGQIAPTTELVTELLALVANYIDADFRRSCREVELENEEVEEDEEPCSL